MLASKAGFNGLTKHETGVFCIDAVYHNLDKVVASKLKALSKKSVDGVYAYEDAAFNSFNEAKKHGIKCFYDLPIGYWRTARKLLETEKERWPEWSTTLTGFQDSEAKLQRKDEELRLADRIFVASTFTASTLKDYPGQLAPIEVIPYGFPPVNSERHYERLNKRHIKLLFVGGLSQRKGIADLFAVAQKFRNFVDLTVVGRKVTEDCKPLNAALQKHRWMPSLPHAQILNLMREHDVLVFPSLFEGFGLVITEAMSQGTPVITTERTAGPDIIKNNQDGWIVEAASTEALEASIEKLIQNPSLIKEAGRNAMKTAISRTWETYGREVAMTIKKMSSE